MTKVSPSILSADFAHMGKAVDLLKDWQADMVHCDVMDGAFVPNITFGSQMIAALRKETQLTLDVHLMVDRPERYIEDFAKAGADIITVHQEATVHLQRTLRMIRDAGAKPGVVLNPATPLETLKYILADVEMILLMSVNPGFGGQSFIPAVMQKTADLRRMIDDSGYDIEIEIDGGVNTKNCAELVHNGADVLVAGSAVFSAADPAAVIAEMKKCAR